MFVGILKYKVKTITTIKGTLNQWIPSRSGNCAGCIKKSEYCGDCLYINSMFAKYCLLKQYT